MGSFFYLNAIYIVHRRTLTQLSHIPLYHFMVILAQRSTLNAIKSKTNLLVVIKCFKKHDSHKAI